ncbi:MAG: 5,10-methylenetetrahydrofolate reductase [Candidatus Altiarchaeales archaeon]|nr:5,10-methylenetetrahydrofolate reductase [Candidatus Altiarchaeales archaeon]
MNFKEKITSNQFVVTGEIAPQKGVDTSPVVSAMNLLRDHVDAVNVTDNQNACVRLSSLSACRILIDNDVEPIFQLTCRDRNRIALQSDLMGAWVLGVRNVLILSGDHPASGDHPSAKPVYDLDSIQLLGLVNNLNNGVDLEGNLLNNPTGFFMGAAANPGADDIESEVSRLEKKKNQGACFLQTQVVYDVDGFKKFLKAIKPLNISVLAGIVPLKSAGMARFMNENLPGVKVPGELISELETARDPVGVGVNQAARIIREIKPYCQGIHVMALGAEKQVPKLLREAGLR